MKLKEFCDLKQWSLGFAGARKLVSSGAIKVNNKIATDAEMQLFKGDIVTCGKHRREIVS